MILKERLELCTRFHGTVGLFVFYNPQGICSGAKKNLCQMNGVKVETNSVMKTDPTVTEFLLKMVLEGPDPSPR
jgi:hypothetical protein